MDQLINISQSFADFFVIAPLDQVKLGHNASWGSNSETFSMWGCPKFAGKQGGLEIDCMNGEQQQQWASDEFMSTSSWPRLTTLPHGPWVTGMTKWGSDLWDNLALREIESWWGKTETSRLHDLEKHARLMRSLWSYLVQISFGRPCNGSPRRIVVCLRLW